MSVKAITWAFEQTTALPVDKLILLALADYADQDGTCFPPQTNIAARGMCSLDTVQRSLKRLISIGLVTREKRYASLGSRMSDCYRLQMGATTSSELHRTLRSRTKPQNAAETTPHSYAETKPQSCGLDIEPSLNRKEKVKGAGEEKVDACDPNGVVITATEIRLDAGNREFWLREFEGDAKALDLALIQALAWVQPNSSRHPAVQVGAQLARIVAQNREQTKRYRSRTSSPAPAPAPSSSRSLAVIERLGQRVTA